jgi:hypothetical protein
MPNPSLEVRTLIVDALSVANVSLGNYVFPDNSVHQAIWIDGIERLPPGTQISGLECVILADPNPQTYNVFAGAIIIRSWCIFFKAWDNIELLPAINAMGGIRGLSLERYDPGDDEHIAFAEFSILRE